MSERDTILDLFVEPSETDSIEEAAMFAGRYRIVSLIGSGGMGAVYRVHDEKLDEVVALKLLKGAGPQTAARLRSEVVMARRVTHPHVVRTFDLGEDGDQLFLTMEYIEGDSLGTRLLTDGPLDERTVLELGRQLASAVDAAHQAGVLHRDLKPDNVLIPSLAPLRAVLTDFGIAEAVAGGTGTRAGSPPWMSPEQRRGALPDARSEIWALGAILYEALTGTRASDGVDSERLTSGLGGVISRCLELEPERRYGSAAVLGAALAEVAAASQAPVARRVAGPAQRILHVVPFRMVGPPDAAYVAEGLTEEVVEALSASPGLGVMSGATIDPSAQALVEGSLRWTGAGPIRVSAKLKERGQGHQIWAKKASCGPEALLALGELMAREIAEAMTLNRPSRALSAMSPAASSNYFRARALLREHWDGDLRPAADLLVAALALHPEEPAILALLAVVRSRQAFFAPRGEQDATFELAHQAAIRAIRADPSRGEPWMALAQGRIYAGDTPIGAAALRRAADLAPGSPDVHRMLGYLLLEAGRAREAVGHLELALAASIVGAWTVLARAYAYLGRWDRATELVEENRRINPIDSAFHAARWFIWGHTAIQGRALELVRDVLSRPDLVAVDERPHTPGLRVDRYDALSALERLLDGHRPERERIVAGIAIMRQASGPRLLAARAQFVAEFAAASGHDDLALEVVELSASVGLEDLQWLDHCPCFDRVRGDERFQATRIQVAERADATLAALDGDPDRQAALDALVA